MNSTIAGMDTRGLIRLYDATDDLQCFYDALAEILAARFGAEGFAVHLWDRRHQPFLDHARGSFVAEENENWLSVPLTVRGQDFGALRLPPDIQADPEDLRECARHISLALYQHKLLEDQGRIIKESLSHVQALKAMGELLGDLDQELVLNRVLKFFIDLLGADVGAALLHEDEECLVKARWGMPSNMLHLLYTAGREADHTQTDEPLQCLALRDEVTENYSFGSILRLRLKLKAPYDAELYVVSGDELPVGPHLRTIVSSCQVIASIALQNTLDHRDQIRAHRLNEQLVVARDIQRQLLPTELPCSESLCLAGRSLPAQYIGGDYYDVLKLDNGDLLAIVADVSGKGVQAAMRMTGLRAMLHHHASQALGPGELLDRLNSYLGENPLQGHFITACCARIEKDGSLLRIASAGHEPPVLLPVDEEPTLLDCQGGLPLGIFPDQHYGEIEVDLQAGDRLLIYTDGITDTCNDVGERFEAERMVACFQNHGGKSAAELLEQLFDEVEAFRGKVSWVDDLTALTIHCLAKGNG